MKKQALLSVLVLGLMIGLAGASAHAQDDKDQAPYKFTLFGGYSYLVNDWGNECAAACDSGVTDGLHGYTGSVTYNLKKFLGIEANFAGHNGSPQIFSEAPTSTENGFNDTERQDFYTYTFGPKVMWPVGNFTIFGHFLVGGAHAHEGFSFDDCTHLTGSTAAACTPGSGDASSSRGNGFALKTGGGLDWNHGRWGIRILEVDYVHISTDVTETEDDCPTCAPEKMNVPANDLELSAGVIVNFGANKKPLPPVVHPPVASCSLDKSSVFVASNDTVNITATASDPDGFPLTYSWTATGGSVDGTGPQVRWMSAGVPAGNYTVTATVGDGRAGNTATCSVNPAVAVRPNRPPTVTLTSDRDTVFIGEKVLFTAVGADPDNDPLTYTWRTTCGQLSGSGTTDTLDTTGLPPGVCTVTVRVDDGRGGAADASKGVTVQAPPPPPQASKLNTCDFKPASSPRVDNVCKRILDDVGLRLQNEPKGTVVIIGYSDPKPAARAAKLAADRGENAKKYLTDKGVDASRITTRTGAGQAGATDNSRIDIEWVPEGATF